MDKVLQRFDPVTGDRLDIKPVPPKGDSAYRWDWDSPLAASKHFAGKVFIGGNRLFISRDYGSSWTATSASMCITSATSIAQRKSTTVAGCVRLNCMRCGRTQQVPRPSVTEQTDDTAHVEVLIEMGAQ